MSPGRRATTAGRSPFGAYVILVRLPKARVLVIQRGARGRPSRSRRFTLPEGDYLYVGSALGPGGLAARAGRHLASQKTRHWDIDFLLSGPRRPRATIFARASSRRGLECRWAKAVARAQGTSPVVGVREGERRAIHGFGAGDCQLRCGCGPKSPNSARTHLFRVGWKATARRVREVVGEAADAFVPLGDLLGVEVHPG